LIRFSIIIPTIGRETLKRTLRSVMEGGFDALSDELLVIGDGPQPAARSIVEGFGSGLILYRETCRPTRNMGASQRAAAMALSSGSHLLFMDDDDVYLPEAITTVRRIVGMDSERIHIFRMRSSIKPWSILWKSPECRPGNVGTPMFAVPNVKSLLGSWGPERGSDFEFIRSTLKKWPGGEESIAWRQETVAEIF
jgi:glycosyltransferase involved in cell wall biosynthesis